MGLIADGAVSPACLRCAAARGSRGGAPHARGASAFRQDRLEPVDAKQAKEEPMSDHAHDGAHDYVAVYTAAHGDRSGAHLPRRRRPHVRDGASGDRPRPLPRLPGAAARGRVPLHADRREGRAEHEAAARLFPRARPAPRLSHLRLGGVRLLGPHRPDARALRGRRTTASASASTRSSTSSRRWPNERVFNKITPSAFTSTPIEIVLARLRGRHAALHRRLDEHVRRAHDARRGQLRLLLLPRRGRLRRRQPGDARRRSHGRAAPLRRRRLDRRGDRADRGEARRRLERRGG